jgi:GAF domain-containing protein
MRVEHTLAGLLGGLGGADLGHLALVRVGDERVLVRELVALGLALALQHLLLRAQPVELARRRRRQQPADVLGLCPMSARGGAAHSARAHVRTLRSCASTALAAACVFFAACMAS